MPTLDEILNATSNLTIDLNTRVISIPSGLKNIGVESDEDVTYLPFTMPRYYGHIDLFDFTIRINYLNANGEPDIYEVEGESSSFDGNSISFTWVVGRHATKYKGNVTFVVCLKKTDGSGNIEQEFNTTIASLKVLEGLETSDTVLEESIDLLEQWKREVVYVPRLIDITPQQIGATKFLVQLYPNDVYNITNYEGELQVVIRNDMKFDRDNEWMFIITQGDTPYNVTFAPTGEFPGGLIPEIEWQAGFAPTFAANTVTDVRFYYRNGVLKGVWDV